MLPKMSGYTKKHDDETKYILLIEGDELLKKYNNIQNKVSNNVNKESDNDQA